jgi:hypothetical protein
MTEKEKRIIKIVITYKNKKEETIYTDDTVYILNNDGKTCEKIGI